MSFVMLRSLRWRIAVVTTTLLALVVVPGFFFLKQDLRREQVEFEVTTRDPRREPAATPPAETIERGLAALAAKVRPGVLAADLQEELEHLACASRSLLVLDAPPRPDGSVAPRYVAPNLGGDLEAVPIDGSDRVDVRIDHRDFDGNVDRIVYTGMTRTFAVPSGNLLDDAPSGWTLRALELPSALAARIGWPSPSLSRDPIWNSIRFTIWAWRIGLALVVLLTATLFRIVRPIRELTAAVRRFGGGDRTARVAVRGRDELADLGVAFNTMADRMVRADELRRTLVADVAHELRTPLTNLRGQLEAVQDGLARADGATVAALHDEVLLLTRITEDLQLLAVADAGELRLVRAPVDVAALVQKTAAAMRPQFTAARVELAVHRDDAVAKESEARLVGDADRLGQVLRNLIANALRHAPAGSVVDLSLRRDAAAWVVTVADRGPGIDAALAPRLFERFARGDPSRSRATGGAGLGLAVVKTLVEAHGGSVSGGNRDGGGACFVVTLPAGAI